MGDWVSFVLSHNTLFAGVLLFVLGNWLFFGRREDRRKEPLAGLLVYTAFWLFAFTLRLHTEDVAQQIYWQRAVYYTASFLPLFHYLLVLTLVRNSQPSQRFQVALASLNFALLPVVFIFPLVIVADGGGMHFGPALPVLWAHYAVMVAASLATIVSRWSDLRKKMGRAAYPFVVGSLTVLGAVFSILYGGAAGQVGDQMWLGGLAAMSALAGLILVSYAVDQFEFTVRMRPVGLELFFLVVLIALVLDIVVAAQFVGFSIRLAAALALILYGTLAVRTLSREVEQLREGERLHAKLLEQKALLEADSRFQTRLLSFATHQLRAILSGIRSYLDMLYHGDFGELAPRQKEITGVTLVATERLGDTVETFLDVAKIEGGRLQVEKAPLEFGGLVAKVIHEFAPLAVKKGLSLIRDVTDDLPPWPGDSGKLYHAAANLVHNAINYTDRGGVTVSVTADADRLTVRVTDTGIGLDETSRAHVSDLLGQGLSAVRFEESGGSGLGLYITKAIVDAHGGEMIVESSGPGKGSTFGFSLPR
jgi:signal transduction histidine kinase